MQKNPIFSKNRIFDGASMQKKSDSSKGTNFAFLIKK
jgi:hypothetical protein